MLYVYTDHVTGVSSMRFMLHLDELHERFIGKTAGADKKEEGFGKFSSVNQNFSFELMSRERHNNSLIWNIHIIVVFNIKNSKYVRTDKFSWNVNWIKM